MPSPFFGCAILIFNDVEQEILNLFNAKADIYPQKKSLMLKNNVSID